MAVDDTKPFFTNSAYMTEETIKATNAQGRAKLAEVIERRNQRRADEYERLAEHCAKEGFNAAQALEACTIPAWLAEEIGSDPEHFNERVNAYRYATALGRTDD